ncbi:alkaline phosphatase D family protein [Ponticaulis sp.]|uniref:alkaline phosphatase D family protein n=1 Tax=Ponticaulis sp. TaxID=2020902 RepID=UPI000B6B601B|nr:alkaline phosphatase D family protein [Ponticaulis sp.]MAJ07765.1 alkaline phosphatase [Ponticaulis sp.]RPG18088.1 MAG: alkaline phosphatase family protein [Hyphomonadaceae bacterium TMED125]HBJ91589.1 alkaline phosphatase [Hyphomonadaceae bacterium]|tara:strand:+ start:59362 stop:60540 length:1179 start_codon:yes stop_codon:yes gene_type:complete
MKHIGVSLIALAALGACATQTATSPAAVSPQSAEEALSVYYRAIPTSELPSGPEILPLSTSEALTRVIVASCNDEEQPNPAMARIAEEDADLFLFIGDNVYGDRDGRNYANADFELAELHESYADLGVSEAYNAVAAAMPILATWDDHDFGMNDFGRNFAGRILAERMFENFFHMDDTEIADYPGVYYSRMVGPEGQRTQIIMLDTRFFRSDLMPTDDYGAAGRERYIPSTDPAQDMLGEAQWAWLEQELSKPADLRLLVSSIQVIPDVHGWESWDKMPTERQRLYDMIEETEANGVVFVSGDRHTSFLYKDEERGAYPFYEITASSLNVAFASEPDSTEVDPRQLGLGYTFGNYGEIEIDWNAGQINFIINDETGEEVRSTSFSMDEINAG